MDIIIAALIALGIISEDVTVPDVPQWGSSWGDSD